MVEFCRRVACRRENDSYSVHASSSDLVSISKPIQRSSSRAMTAQNVAYMALSFIWHMCQTNGENMQQRSKRPP